MNCNLCIFKGENGSDSAPDILQFAPVNVISVEDCQDDWLRVSEQNICNRDDNGEISGCRVTYMLLIYFLCCES